MFKNLMGQERSNRYPFEPVTVECIAFSGEKRKLT